MKKVILAVIIIVLGFHASCQRYYFRTGLDKSILKRHLGKYIVKNNYKTSIIEETDSSMLLSLRDSTVVVPTDYYYHFNKWKICDVEEDITHCSVCLLKTWNEILNDTTYKWKKVNSNKYLSKFSKRRIIEIVDDKISCPYLKITRIKWSKKEYNALLKEMV